MKPQEAEKIFQRTKQIHGWFAFEAAMIFAWIDEIQKSNGISGDFFEIGVYHGKSTVFLGAMLDPAREKLGVCDIFQKQSNSLSGSAFGDREIFEHNLKTYVDGRLQTRIFGTSSSELTVEDIGRNHRFIHIDGAHGKDEVYSDLKLAASATIPEGVITLDDAMTLLWPGVAEAIFHFLSSDERFCAIIAGFNKMCLVRREFAELYTREIDDEKLRVNYKLLYPWHLKKSPFMNYPLRVFYIPPDVGARAIPRKWSLHTKLIRYYDQHNWPKHSLLRPTVALTKSIIGKR